MAKHEAHKKVRAKVSVVLALIITTAVSAAIAFLSVRQVYTTGPLLRWTLSSRATIQIFVHLLSVALATLQIFALSSFISFRTNMQILSSPLSLDALKLRQALNAKQLDFNLPTGFLLIALFWLLVVQVPGAIWAGAISPVITTAKVFGTFSVPSYSTNSSAFWGQACHPAEECSFPTNTSNQDTVSNMPWKSLPGVLLDSVHGSSSRNSSIASHKKIDSPQFSFYGRSYGVASVVGLLGSPDINGLEVREYPPKVNQFSFGESGYNSAVQCTYNAASDLRFDLLQEILNPGSAINSSFTGSIAVLQAVGSLPTGVWPGFTTMSIVDNSTAVALASVANDTTYLYGFLGGKFYPFLNNIQCEATFTPTFFHVAVDVLAQNISVTPTLEDSGDIDSTGGLINNTFMGVSFVSQILTTMYTGILGDALLTNINAVSDRENHTTATQNDKLTGLAESLERLIDDYFGAIGASQLLIYDQSSTVDSTVQIEILQLGQPVYAYVTWALNLAILVLFGYEAGRTKFWKSLPIFNCLDTKSAILGATANNVRELPELVQSWKGNDGDRVIGELQVMLNSNRPVLRLMHSNTYELVPTVDTVDKWAPDDSMLPTNPDTPQLDQQADRG